MIPLGLLFNRYTALAALVVAVGIGAAAYRTALIQKGYDKAMTEVEAHRADTLREFIKERSRQLDIVKGLQDAYNDQTASVAAFRDRARAAERRMRDQDREFEARLAAASAESVRRFAQATERNFEGCIGHVERFAAETASCAGAAHTLKSNLDAVVK